MSVKQLIPAEHHLYRKSFQKDGSHYLNVSEFYYDTIQGEGVYTGHPAMFLRLKGCTLNCSYCDTSEVWRYGTPWTFEELFTLMFDNGLIRRLRQDEHHLVITGGSPLLQQERLALFISEFEEEFGFTPFIEIENECYFLPNTKLISSVACWNNSPKLTNSGVDLVYRYKPEVITQLTKLNSWFKFVISNEYDWKEIEDLYLNPLLIKKEQIILMPEGATHEEILKNQLMVVNLAIYHGVRYSPRLHIDLWNYQKGV